jgi:3-phytase
MTRVGLVGFGFMTLAATALSGCATAPAPARYASAPTATVAPALETAAVGTANADAADDPAIWSLAPGATTSFNGARVNGWVAGTDKKAGLYIFGLDGQQLQFLPEGLLNNVDLREVEVNGRRQVVIGASDRGRMGVALYIFDPASDAPDNQVRPFGFIRSDVAEPYGFCMGVSNGAAHAVLIGKDGQVREYRIGTGGSDIATGDEVRRFAIGSQAEGCTIDEASGHLYVGEEAVGVWRYGFSTQSTERTQIQAVDATGRLIADVEGMSLIRDNGATYLLVSSQGDSAFAVWRVGGGAPAYIGRFHVGAANGVDEVTTTDGIDARSGPVGPFPEGLVVVQDDQNEGAQNFKFIDWRRVREALGIGR